MKNTSKIMVGATLALFVVVLVLWWADHKELKRLADQSAQAVGKAEEALRTARAAAMASLAATSQAQVSTAQKEERAEIGFRYGQQTG